MRYVLATGLALAAFVSVYALASLAAFAAWWSVHQRLARWSAATRVYVCLGLRTGPVLVAGCFVAILIVPAWIAHEPVPSAEPVTWSLVAVATCGATLIAAGMVRTARSIIATRRTSTAWSRRATILRVEGFDECIFAIEHPFPLLATIGTLRPRMFAARHLLAALDRDELAAAIRHELAHRSHYHSLKSLVMRFSRFVLPFAVPAPVDRAFACAIEEQADAKASGGEAASSLALASALVKIARLVPRGMTIQMAATVFAADDDGASLAQRVRKLAENGTPYGRPHSRNVALVVMTALLAAYLLAAPRLVLATHVAIERLLAVLS